MGFDRETKRHFLSAFSDKLGLSCGILYLGRSLRAVSQSYINRSRHADKYELEKSMTWSWPVCRNLVLATVVR